LTANVYEGMFILDSNRFGRDPEAVAGQIQELIEKAGGELLVHRLWEERRLAFPIKGHRKGTYWLTYFRLDSNQLSSVRRQCQLTESILRMLFLKVDPRIVDAVVTHARTASVAPSTEVAPGVVVETVAEAIVVDVEIPDAVEIEAEEEK
jgi:small subunit ribosomal protein S6